MSKAAIAEFLRAVAVDENLQQALLEFAARYGFKFTADEVREVDLLTVSDLIPVEAPDQLDDDSVNSGFGVGEYPA